MASDRPNAAGAVRARAFGSERSDLDLAFAEPARPALVTNLLAACVLTPKSSAYDPEEIWDWTVQQRLQALIALTIATAGREARTAIRCRTTGCAEVMEIELDLSAFEQAPAPDRFRHTLKDDVELVVRLPRGSDQLAWLEQGVSDRAAMARALVRLADGTAPPDGFIDEDRLDGLESALEANDSLTTLQLDLRCPACGTDIEVPFDIEALLLDMLAQTQTTLMDQIHHLARTYHWTESEILSLPARRRAYYLGRVSEGAAP